MSYCRILKEGYDLLLPEGESTGLEAVNGGLDPCSAKVGVQKMEYETRGRENEGVRSGMDRGSIEYGFGLGAHRESKCWHMEIFGIGHGWLGQITPRQCLSAG